MKSFALLLAVIAIVVMMGTTVYAEPTPTQSKLTWDDYTDSAGVGFMLYWAQESESPRIYSDARRVDILRPDPEQVVVIDVKPDASSRLCFKLTAYDSASNESAYSNEACGYFGLPSPQNLSVVP